MRESQIEREYHFREDSLGIRTNRVIKEGL